MRSCCGDNKEALNRQLDEGMSTRFHQIREFDSVDSSGATNNDKNPKTCPPRIYKTSHVRPVDSVGADRKVTSGDKTQPSPQWRNILITPPPATQNKTMGQANDNRGRAGTNTPELPMLRNGGDRSIYPLPTWDENNARNMQEETTTRNGKRSNLPPRYLA